MVSILLLGSFVYASPFYPKTMNREWSRRKVDRDLILPRGTMEMDVGISAKTATGYRDAAGKFQPYEDTIWRYNQLEVHYSHGFSSFIAMYMHIPWVFSVLQTADDGQIQTFALGDVKTGLVVLPWKGTMSQLAIGIELKSPSGVEWPADGRGGPMDVQGFLTGTGTTNLAIDLRYQTRPTSWYKTTITSGYNAKFRAVVGYVVEEDGFGNGKLDPGDEIWANWTHLFQLIDALSVSINGNYSYRTQYLIGSSGEGLSWENPSVLQPATRFVDVGGTMHYEPTQQVGISASVHNQIYGSDTRLFSSLGLEEFSPQPGLTYGLSGVVRW